jgi:hypothetical protein
MFITVSQELRKEHDDPELYTASIPSPPSDTDNSCVSLAPPEITSESV